jgi:hypothetical protein
MEKNTVVFVPERESETRFGAIMADGCDYPYQLHLGKFYFPCPPSMDIDEFTDLLDGLLKEHKGIEGAWHSVSCDSPEEILMDLENTEADNDQTGTYYIPGQIQRHNDYLEHDDDDDLQKEQMGREESMTLAFIHGSAESVRLLRKILNEDISETLSIEIQAHLKRMNLTTEE